MDSSANEREGYVLKEYNMENLTERSAGRFQIVSETSIGFRWA
jgi:hypothetical protein